MVAAAKIATSAVPDVSDTPVAPATSAKSRPDEVARTSLDLAIIGSGPAALTAALYAARAGLTCSVFERAAIGGALTEISKISNFPGFSGPGPELAEVMQSQAIAAGAKINYGDCTAISVRPQGFELTIDDEPVKARAVLVATGSEPRTLDFAPRPPVSYCALCDGDLVQGKRVAVVGGANSAVQEAIYLAGLAESVTIISHSALRADDILRQKLPSIANLKVVEHQEPDAEFLDQFDHIFVFIGKRPASRCVESLAETLLNATELLDSQKYIITGHAGTTNMTIVPGLFAAGDVRANAVRQAITAAADGASAAIEVTNFLKRHA